MIIFVRKATVAKDYSCVYMPRDPTFWLTDPKSCRKFKSELRSGIGQRNGELKCSGTSWSEGDNSPLRGARRKLTSCSDSSNAMITLVRKVIVAEDFVLYKTFSILVVSTHAPSLVSVGFGVESTWRYHSSWIIWSLAYSLLQSWFADGSRF